MFRRNKELWWALAAIIVVTAGYSAFIAAAGLLPSASKLVGHGIGVVGFVLMLLTETLYTLRKRAKNARWGRVSSWLRFHIFTGLVGSYLVLLHPAMRFHGLAAVLSLLTAVVAVSGIVGRYLYTRVPRAVTAGGGWAPGASPETAAASTAAVPASRRALATWRAIHVPLTLALFIVAAVHIVGAVYYATLLH